MDFNLSDDQTAVRDLARGILEKEVTVERLKAARAGGRRGTTPRSGRRSPKPDCSDSWCPPTHGGMGLGLLGGLRASCRSSDASLAPGPFLPTLARRARDRARRHARRNAIRWLGPVAARRRRARAGARRRAAPADPLRPGDARRSETDAAGCSSGEKRVGPGRRPAPRRLLVPARTNDGARVFLVDPAATGVTLGRQRLSTGEPVFTVTLAGVRVDDADVLAGEADDAGGARVRLYESTLVAHRGDAARRLRARARHDRALRPRARAVRRADRLLPGGAASRSPTATSTSSRCAGRPGAPSSASPRAGRAARECAVAKFWAADGGARIATACQHLHGGIGVDLDYPDSSLLPPFEGARAGARWRHAARSSASDATWP